MQIPVGFLILHSTKLKLYKPTWINAKRLCNLLSKNYNLPIAREEKSGDFLKSSGFRLPTPNEWEYAAKGWSGVRSGKYLEIQKQHYKIPEIDFPITPNQILAYKNGYSYTDEISANELGIYGMLAYAKEWCYPAERHEHHLNQYIRWEEYILNYDNAIGYRTVTTNASVDAHYAFRIVLPV